MMPVPSCAGCISTRAAPCRPLTTWCRVPFFSFTLNSLRRASSMAFCTATGTSRALPLPMPMPPSPSPTTVSAAKPSTRPPFTTLVTRLTAIIFSRSPSPRSSDCCILGWIFAINPRSELQAAGASRVGQSLHAAVVLVAGAVECDLLDALFLRLRGDALADHLGRLARAAVLQLPAHLLLQRGRARQHLVARGRHELRVDVAVGTVHGQADRAVVPDPDAGLARASKALVVFGDHVGSRYFFFVSFSSTTSSA